MPFVAVILPAPETLPTTPIRLAVTDALPLTFRDGLALELL
jgi:hypothetical protein